MEGYGNGKTTVLWLLVLSLVNFQKQNIIKVWEFKETAAKIMFKHDLTYCQSWKISFKIFSSIKHLQSSLSHRAPGTHCWEFRCTLSCFQMMKITIPPVWSNNSYEIQRNFKCILSNICHCNINSLMRLWVRRGLEIFHFPLRISRLILCICYWPGAFAEPGSKHTVEMTFLQRCLFSHKAMARHSHLYHSNIEYTVSCLRRWRGKTLSVINSVFKKCVILLSKSFQKIK